MDKEFISLCGCLLCSNFSFDCFNLVRDLFSLLKLIKLNVSQFLMLL